MTLTLQGNGTLNGLTVLGAPVTTLANTGTAASPSLVFDGDSDTGLFRPGANQLALSVGGSAVLTIASNGQTTLTGTVEVTDGTQYVKAYETGFVQVNRTNGANFVFEGRLSNSTTSSIKGDGTATFVGRVDAGSSTLDNAAIVGAANHATKGVIQAYHYNNGSVWVAGGADGVTKSEITAGGSTTFASTMHTGSGSADSRITIGSHGTAGTNDSVHVRADSANLLFMCGSGGVTKFEQNGTLQLVIDSNRNVGINQATPTSQSGKVLHISGDSGGQARIHLTTSASGHGADEGSYIIAQGAESGAFAGQLSITNLENRDIVFGTGTSYTEKLRIQNAGGISFNGDTATANALDDYEEGSWTPTFVNGGTGTYVIRVGYYTKIGNKCTATFFLQFSNAGTASGNVVVGGFPFATQNIANLYAISSSIHGTGWSVTRNSINLIIAPNNTQTNPLYYNMVAQGATYGQASHADLGTGNLLASFTYLTN